MLHFDFYNHENNDTLTKNKRNQLLDFLFDHLDQFGDPKPAIEKAITYALSDNKSEGGFILYGYEDDELVGAVVVNDTGMSGYIPDHVLVYIAVNRNKRGQGYGTQLMEKTLELCEGDVKLHVEYDNPAKRLYERVGFTSKYAEMRYIQDSE